MMLDLVPLLFFLPLLSFPVVLFFGRWLPLKGAGLTIAVMAGCFAWSLALLAAALLGAVELPYSFSISWFSFDIYDVALGVYLDGLTVTMLCVVTLVSLLVQIYSLGYMQGDSRFSRYYSYMTLFTASMLGLVLADNMLVLFACWELVGLCSYLLIGFWFEKPEAAQASRKAFITTKLGDLGFAIGLYVIFTHTGTFSIPSLQEMARAGFFAPGVALWSSLLLFCGAMGKSAQVPLFVWLPDAMEGPTPVSALIHAATMVAAGVFMVAKLFFLFEINPTALIVVGFIGAATAFLAALMGLVPEDIKRVLAYSTVSQLGYMMAGLAVGGPQVGSFHLVTHAMFKALLFLGAGSVIHAMHTNDIWKMGALSVRMPITFVTFAIGVLALSGIFPLSGFYSKDEILHAALNSGNWPVTILLFSTSALTAFYMTRVLVLVFLGSARDRERYGHSHESPASMTAPLVILAALSVVMGFLMHGEHVWGKLVPHKLEHEHGHVPAILVALLSSVVALSGMAAAFGVYFYRWIDAAKVKERFDVIWLFLYDRMGFDRFWLAWVKLSYKLADALAWLDYHALDQGLVDGQGSLTRQLSRASEWIDRYIIDNLVDLWGWISLWAGSRVRVTVSGFVQSYLLYVILGISLIFAARMYF
ncbi:MAG: NADH-quinone oxidoreductase subunit L [Elusimicrobia bacterium]|nr:NADH-quinone oxidoreductase subunit L [Elusimicrobiota bacterium]